MSKFGIPQPPLQINFEVHRIPRQKERPEPQGWAWEGDVFNVSVRLQYTTHELQELARGLAVQRQQGELLSYYREELALLSGRRELPQAVEQPASLLPDRRRCLQHEVADEALQRHRGEQVLELPCNGEGIKTDSVVSRQASKGILSPRPPCPSWECLHQRCIGRCVRERPRARWQGDVFNRSKQT